MTPQIKNAPGLLGITTHTTSFHFLSGGVQANIVAQFDTERVSRILNVFGIQRSPTRITRNLEQEQTKR